MNKSINLMARNKVTVLMLSFTLIVGGISAQAAGILNSDAGGYLVCVNSKTKVITHPGTAKCPKGNRPLVFGAQGATGITGATGFSGKDGRDGIDGKDGKTLWNGVKDPENSWGAPGDIFINSVTKTLFGPKDLTTGWPVGVSMVGPAGAQGPIGLTGATGPQGPGGSGPAGPAGTNGTNATIAITELFVCDGSDVGTVADEKCKIGMTGPGGGLIFFVDYNDQYAGFNYLEAAPSSCQALIAWSSAYTSVPAAWRWAARAVGAGSTNTTAIKAVFTSNNSTNNAAHYATACSAGSKNDWFLGSIGEMKLMYDNLLGFGEFESYNYWSSSEFNESNALQQRFDLGHQNISFKDSTGYVRPVRSF